MLRRSFFYLAWVFLIIIVLIISGPQLLWIRTSCIREYAMCPYFMAQFGLFLLIGIMLGFSDRLGHEIKKKGSWGIDICKIIFCGIPIALFACSNLFYYGINVPVITNFISSYIIHIDSGQIVASQIILGFVLITSFFKKTS